VNNYYLSLFLSHLSVSIVITSLYVVLGFLRPPVLSKAATLWPGISKDGYSYIYSLLFSLGVDIPPGGILESRSDFQWTAMYLIAQRPYSLSVAIAPPLLLFHGPQALGHLREYYFGVTILHIGHRLPSHL